MFSILILGDAHMVRLRRALDSMSNAFVVTDPRVDVVGFSGLTAETLGREHQDIAMNYNVIVLRIGAKDVSRHSRYPKGKPSTPIKLWDLLKHLFANYIRQIKLYLCAWQFKGVGASFLFKV